MHSCTRLTGGVKANHVVGSFPHSPFCYHPGVTGFDAFLYDGGELNCEGTPLTGIARRAGTPSYVYSRRAIRDSFRRLKGAFSTVDPLICYSLKANDNLSLLRVLQDEGSGFDVVSGGEMFRLQQIGADPGGIVFSGVGKTVQEMEMALEWGLFSINVESRQELETLAQVSRRMGREARVAIRINPDVDARTHPYIATGLHQHKFGVETGQVDDLLEIVENSPEIRLVGLGYHIGSQILDVQPFLDAFGRLREWADRMRDRGIPLEHLDLGGGLGIAYQGETGPDLQRYAEELARRGEGYRIVMEPGRYLVGNAGVLLTRVLYRKANRGKVFLVVDAAMTDLLRPSLYGAQHQILPVRSDRSRITADVVGPVCESGDFLARGQRVPDAHPGDILAVMSAGAYGFVLSSNYNSRRRAAEILVDGEEWAEIRTRETYEDLVRGESGS